MDAVDVSEHYEVTAAEETPSLLSVIIDTNPRAWAALDHALPLSRALANILIFINAHLAFSNSNQVAVIAAHTKRAVWLYPSPSDPPYSSSSSSSSTSKDVSGDVQMQDAPPDATNGPSNGAGAAPASSPNKYPQFAQIESTVLAGLRKLMKETTETDLEATTTQLSGALTLALSHYNKALLSLSSSAANSSDPAARAQLSSNNSLPALKSRILVVSVSDSDPSQYIPTMNAVFAASYSQVAIDTLSLSGDPTFLQQASFNTNGTYITALNPRGILSYLMFGLIADTEARTHLVTPTSDTTDFRAACFCHGRVVDTGFVCSICLSIFCEVPENAECLTCGTKLALGNYGSNPAVVPRKKKKKKKVINGVSVTDGGGSAAGTPQR